MAAKSPKAVATKASAMPGATVTRLADFLTPIPIKESIMPHTVPKRPIKGVTLPVVAKKLIIFSNRATSLLEALMSDLLMLSRLSDDKEDSGLDFLIKARVLNPDWKREAKGLDLYSCEALLTSARFLLFLKTAINFSDSFSAVLKVFLL